MAITAPTKSLGLNFSCIKRIEKGIISTGTMEIIAEATPVVVNRTAQSEAETPMNGPKKAPMARRPMAFEFCRALRRLPHLLNMVKISEKPTSLSLIHISEPTRPY